MAIYESWKPLKPNYKADLSKGADGLRGAPYAILQFWIDAANERIDMLNLYAGTILIDPIEDYIPGTPTQTVIRALLASTINNTFFTGWYLAKELIGTTASGAPDLHGTEDVWPNWTQANAELVLGPMPYVLEDSFPINYARNEPIADWLYWFYQYLNGAIWGGQGLGGAYPLRVTDLETRFGSSGTSYADALVNYNAAAWIPFPSSLGQIFGGSTEINRDGPVEKWNLLRQAVAINQVLPPGKSAGLHVFGRGQTNEFFESDRVIWIPERPYVGPNLWNLVKSFDPGSNVTRYVEQIGRIGFENAPPPGADIAVGNPETTYQGWNVNYKPYARGGEQVEPIAVLTWDNPAGFRFVE